MRPAAPRALWPRRSATPATRCSTRADEREALLASLVAHQRPILLRCLDVRLPPSDGFTVTKCARWHTLVLKGTEQEQWEAMDPATRRAVRKARREGVEIRPIAPGPGLAAFHRLHVALRKSKYRLLAQPLGFFEAIASRFAPANAWHALGAWIGDRLIAGTIYLRWGDTLYYKFNASAVDALDVRPNSLLTWAGIELAMALGCRQLDLGPERRRPAGAGALQAPVRRRRTRAAVPAARPDRLG